MIELIAMTVDGGIISIDNQIPLILEAHLQRIRDLTYDKTIVMGHNTYESLLAKNALSSGAKDVVIVSRKTVRGSKSVQFLTSLLKEYSDFIVLGGASIFADTVVIADRVFITEVSEKPYEGEYKYFPSLKQFYLVNPNATFLHEGDTYYRFLIYKRNG